MRLGPNLLALLAGVVLSLVFIEIFLQAFPHVALSPSERRELSWREKHKTAQQILTRSQYSFDVYSADLGWELKPNLRTPRLNSNSKGLRGRREYDVNPPAGVRRILCVGDSFIFGENLTDEETLPAQLETMLNREGRWEVLNLGVHGYGVDQQWLRLNRLGFQYHADAVVIGVFEEDLGRDTMSFRDYAKPYYELVRHRLVLRNARVPSPEELLSHARESSSCRLRLWCALRLITEHLARALPKLSLEHTREGKVTLAILDNMLKSSRDHGMQLILVTIPDPPFQRTPSKEEALLSQWAVRTGTPLVNLRMEYLRLPLEDQPRLYAGHWTPYGTGVAAQLVAKKIAEVSPAFG